MGLPAPYLNKQARDILSRYEIGGVILFNRNCENHNQLKQLIEDIKITCISKPFIAIDFEGGRVRRGVELFNVLEAAEYYAPDKLQKLRDDCLKVGQQFKELGINVNFAPVADLKYNPENPALAERTFSDDPAAVAEYCQAFIAAFTENGILTCLKHFPGLGSAANDPHEKMSVTCRSIERFINYDFIPFKTGIESGVPMVMTTHVLASALDSKLATFSENITKLMRNFGFNGIIVSDDMFMGAVNGDNLPQRVLESLVAGHDLTLVCHGINRYEEIIETLENNISLLEKHGHSESIRRIENAKTKFV